MTQHYIVEVERTIAGVEVDQTRLMTADDDQHPIDVAESYYSKYWGERTERRTDFGRTYFENPGGTETVQIYQTIAISDDEFETLKEYLVEIKP